MDIDISRAMNLGIKWANGGMTVLEVILGYASYERSIPFSDRLMSKIVLVLSCLVRPSSLLAVQSVVGRRCILGKRIQQTLHRRGIFSQGKSISACLDKQIFSDVVYSIQTTYLREGTAVMSQRHGGNLGSFEMIDFTDDPLTWVSGYSGTICLDPKCAGHEETSPWNYEKVITSLKFGTAKSTYGPFGKESGVPFSFKSTTGNCGFHGWSTDKRFGYLRAIGVYIRCPAMRFLGEPSPESQSGTSSISSLSLN